MNSVAGKIIGFGLLMLMLLIFAGHNDQFCPIRDPRHPWNVRLFMLLGLSVGAWLSLSSVGRTLFLGEETNRLVAFMALVLVSVLFFLLGAWLGITVDDFP
jgi:hypothetical protein